MEIIFTNGNSVYVAFSFVCDKSSLITSYSELRGILINAKYNYTTDVYVQTNFPASGVFKSNGVLYNAYTFGYNFATNSVNIDGYSSDGNYLAMYFGETITGYSGMTFNDCIYKTNI